VFDRGFLVFRESRLKAGFTHDWMAHKEE